MKGQSLIEVLVALGLIAILATGVVVVVTSALSNAQFSQEQTLATKYAQEGFEITRGIRDANYQTFASYNGNYCLGMNANTLGPVQANCTQNVNQFVRSVRIEQVPGCGANVAKIITTVSWRDGKCTSASFCHKAEHVSCLSRVRP